MTKRLISIVTLAASVSLALFAFADEKKASAPPMDEKAMMEAFMKYSMPGDVHKKLAGMEGMWSAKVKSWMAPGAPPEVTDATSEMKMVLGGRYLQQNFQGSMMGMPFSGIGYTGFDNYKKQFVSTWMDSASTAVMIMNGTMDATGKVAENGEMDDIMQGKKTTIRSLWTMSDADHQLFEMWTPGPDGKDMKIMEIAYTRKK